MGKNRGGEILVCHDRVQASYKRTSEKSDDEGGTAEYSVRGEPASVGMHCAVTRAMDSPIRPVEV